MEHRRHPAPHTSSPPCPTPGCWPLHRSPGASPRRGADLFHYDIEIASDGSVSGQAPCNHYSANQTAEPPAFKLGPITTTRMACSGNAGRLENRYLAALAQADGITYDGGVLKITGPTYLTFEPGYRK